MLFRMLPPNQTAAQRYAPQRRRNQTHTVRTTAGLPAVVRSSLLNPPHKTLRPAIP